MGSNYKEFLIGILTVIGMLFIIAAVIFLSFGMVTAIVMGISWLLGIEFSWIVTGVLYIMCVCIYIAFEEDN
jgi:hypothetical protein